MSQVVYLYRGYTIEKTYVGCDVKHPNGEYLLLKVPEVEAQQFVDKLLSGDD